MAYILILYSSIVPGGLGLFRNESRKCLYYKYHSKCLFGSGWGRQLKDGGCLVLDNFHLLAELDPTKLKITLIPDLVIGTL